MKIVMVVDDEYALVQTLTDLLEDEGYQVISAPNGDAALARLQTEKPDLILTDYMMPIADGLDLCKGLKSIPAVKDVPVVMMSAVSRATILGRNPRANGISIAGFLNKPFQLNALVGLIRRLIGT